MHSRFLRSTLFLGIWFTFVHAQRLGSLRRNTQQVNCPNDVYHCDNPSDTNIIYCDPTTCRWQTSSLDPNNMPAECVDVTKDEMPANNVPDYLEPCYLWETMYGNTYADTPSPTVGAQATPPPTSAPSKQTPSPTKPSTGSPTESPTDPPIPSSAPTTQSSTAPTLNSGTAAPSYALIELATSRPTGLSKEDPESPADGGVYTENQDSTTTDDYIIELDALLLSYLVTPSVDGRRLGLEVDLPWDVILEATKQYINDTLADVWTVSSVDIEIQQAQSVTFPDLSQLLTAAVWGNVSMPPQVIGSNDTGKDYSAWKSYVESTVRAMVDEAFADDLPGRYLRYLHARSDQADVLSRIKSVEYNLMPSEAASQLTKGNSTATTERDDSFKFPWDDGSGPWYTQTLYIAAMAGGVCVLLAIAIVVCTLSRQRRRRRNYDLQRVKVDTTDTGSPDDISSIGGDKSPEKSRGSSKNQSAKGMVADKSSKSMSRQSSSKQNQSTSSRFNRSASANGVGSSKSFDKANKNSRSPSQTQRSRGVAVNGQNKSEVESSSKTSPKGNVAKEQPQSPSKSDEEELQRVKETYAGASPNVKVGETPLLSDSKRNHVGEYAAPRSPGSVDASELTADDQSVQSRSTIMSIVFELTAVNKLDNSETVVDTSNEKSAPENIFIFGSESDEETSLKSLAAPSPAIGMEHHATTPDSNEPSPPTDLVNADDADSHCVSDNSVLTFDDDHQTDWKGTKSLLPSDNNEDRAEEELLIESPPSVKETGVASIGSAKNGSLKRETMASEAAVATTASPVLNKKSFGGSVRKIRSSATKTNGETNSENSSSTLSTPTAGVASIQRVPSEEGRSDASIASKEKNMPVSGSIASEGSKKEAERNEVTSEGSEQATSNDITHVIPASPNSTEEVASVTDPAKSLESRGPVNVKASQIMTGVHVASEDVDSVSQSSSDESSSQASDPLFIIPDKLQSDAEPAVVSPKNLSKTQSQKKATVSKRTLLATSKPWNQDVVLSRRDKSTDNNVDDSMITQEPEDAAPATQSSAKDEVVVADGLNIDAATPNQELTESKHVSTLQTQEPPSAVVSDDEDDSDDPSFVIPAPYSKYGITPDGARDDMSVCTWDSSVALAAGRRASF